MQPGNPSNKRVLLVDDEPDLLIAMQDSLEPFSSQWQVKTANGGEEALEMLGLEEFEILITDLQMPGMDGIKLLAETRRRHPETARVIMSGYYDRETALRLVSSTHQFLPKPCDADRLGRIIARIFRLRELLTSETLQRLVARIKSLPSLPTTYTELMEELDKDDPELDQIGRIISRDPAMSAKILQLVNSAFFGLPREVSHPSEATMFLGVDLIRGLVLMAHVFTQFERVKVESFSVEKMMEHSWLTGVFARRIAEVDKLDSRTADFAFIAGLLHDVGKLILVANLPELYWEVTRRVDGKGLSFSESEADVIGSNHAEIGAYLLGLWGLPDPVVEAVAFHNRPWDCDAGNYCPAVTVYVASEIEKAQKLDPTGDGLPEAVTKQIEELNLADRIPVWREACRKIVTKD